MRAQVPHIIQSQQLFCCRCRKVTEHGLYAREPYSTYGGMKPHVPLLCVCEKCESAFVAFSNEFAFSHPEDAGDYTRVYGNSRIAAGNWLYFRGSVKPGIVKSYFQTSDKEIIVISYDGGPEKKIELERPAHIDEKSPEGYRLLPAQSAQTLLGDCVYHAIRDQFGVAVGLVKDGDKDKLAVLLEDASVLFITLPQTAQNIPNDKLSEMVQNKLQQLFVEDAGHISVTVGQGIVYLNGLVRNFSVKRSLCACINSMPRIRGCVDFTKIIPEPGITDALIEGRVYTLLESFGRNVFDYKVKVDNGKVSVSVCCFEDSFPRDLENRIAEIPGVLDLAYSMVTIPEKEMENRDECLEMEHSYSLNSRFQGAKIKVSYVENKYLLEGRVHSAWQKQMAFVNAVKMSLSTSVENRLRVVEG